MSLAWVTLENPVSIWWIFLCAASLVNIVAWAWTKYYLFDSSKLSDFSVSKLKSSSMIWLSSLYVFGCAYRSLFPKADVQRICLFDTWLSSVFLGRSVATIAELAFVAQWAIVIRCLSRETHNKTGQMISYLIVPIIFIAELFSWFAVISTNYFGNMIEESLWTITYILITLALYSLSQHFKKYFRFATYIAIFCILTYVCFMIFVDVTMYFDRWRQDTLNGKSYFSFIDGIIDLNTRWIVTHNIQDWKSEIPWMSLYFSFAVLVSILLCYVPLKSEAIKKHLRSTPPA